MRLLIILVHSFVLVYVVLLFLDILKVTRSQSVITSHQVAKEGENEVVIPCNYSQFTDKVAAIYWKEVNKAIILSFVIKNNHIKTVDGRYSLRITSGNAELVIAKPVRNDTNRRFQCEMHTLNGDYIMSNPYILNVYYLDEPDLIASTSSIYEGNSVNLTCSKPDGDPVAYSITWYKDGNVLSCCTGTTKFTTSEDALEIYIGAATRTDGGRYMCKAESELFRGEDGRTSNQIDLKVICTYLTITFESEAGIAICTAKGHPKPFSVMIYNDGKMIEKGEHTASVKINEKFCKRNITCYAENGEVNATEPLKTCNTKNIQVNATEPLLKTCNTVQSSCITLTIGMFFVGVFVGCFGLVAGSIGYNKIKQKISEAVRNTGTRTQDTYAPYIADTGDARHMYQDLQQPNAVYVNTIAEN